MKNSHLLGWNYSCAEKKYNGHGMLYDCPEREFKICQCGLANKDKA